MDFVLGFDKNLSEDTWGGAEFAEEGIVVGFEFGAAFAGEAMPVVCVGDAEFFVVGWLTVFVSHFEEDHVGELFEVVTVAYAVVTEGVTVAPDFSNDRGCIHGDRG